MFHLPEEDDMLHVQVFTFFIIQVFSILLFMLVFVKVPGARILWHTAELPGQIVVNAETEEGESQWHLEDEVPAERIHHACRCALQLEQVDHYLPQQGNCWR